MVLKVSVQWVEARLSFKYCWDIFWDVSSGNTNDWFVFKGPPSNISLVTDPGVHG